MVLHAYSEFEAGTTWDSGDRRREVGEEVRREKRDKREEMREEGRRQERG